MNIKQQIALDPRVLQNIENDWGDENRINFFTLIKNLKENHVILYDLINNNSEWLLAINLIIKSSNHQDFKDFLRCYFNREKNLLHLQSVQFAQRQEIVHQLAKTTKDKIGLTVQKAAYQDIRYYSFEEFINSKYDSKCRLFRIPKAITINPGECFSCKDIFAPFVRNAKKIEFVDKFLFNPSRSVYGTDLMLSVLKLVSNPESIILYSGRKNDEDLKLNVEKALLSKYGGDIFRGTKLYSGKKIMTDSSYWMTGRLLFAQVIVLII